MMICCCTPVGRFFERSIVCCETVLTSPFVFVAILSSSPRSSRFRQSSQGPAARYLACRYDRYARSRIRAPPAAQGGAAVAACPGVTFGSPPVIALAANGVNAALAAAPIAPYPPSDATYVRNLL